MPSLSGRRKWQWTVSCSMPITPSSMRAGGALIPPIPGLDQVPYLTNSSMMDVDFLPPHLIVLGGSYIGLEFAQVYRRFGSEVTVIELAPRLIAREDEDVSSAMTELLKEEGIDVRLDSKVVGVERQGNCIAVKVESILPLMYTKAPYTTA